MCGATLVAVIVLRLVWVFFARYLLVRPGPDGRPGRSRRGPTRSSLGWAGMRGVVTLAAAFVIPPDTPHRDVLLLIAFTVTAGTLFLQGLSLPWLARRLQVPSPDPGADALARANLLHQASLAGLAELDQLEEEDPHSVSETIRDRVQRRDYAAWERVGAGADETPSEIYARRRKLMIDAERERVLEIRDTGTVAHEVVDEVLAMLDVEESMLDYSGERARAGPVDRRRPCTLEGDCEHLREVRPPVEPGHPRRVRRLPARGHGLGAPADVRQLRPHRLLRLLTRSGTPARTTRRVGHAVMRSAEPGEDWRWCFVDQLTGLTGVPDSPERRHSTADGCRTIGTTAVLRRGRRSAGAPTGCRPGPRT